MIRTGSDVMRAGVVVALMLMTFAPARAQVMLGLRPRVGDTLHTRLEQQTDVSATLPGNAAAPARSVTTTLTVSSRTIVRASQGTHTTVLTIVDSASLTSSDAHAGKLIADAQRSLEGQQLVLQLGVDGTVESARNANGAAVSRDAADAMTAMPALFPRKAVSVGEQWMREMPLPAGGPFGARGAAHARATFRLDSLQRTGPLAFVSMHGDIVPDSTTGMQISGTITGAMQIDRVRGWMTDSRVVVLVKSLVAPPAAVGLGPMRFTTRVTQRLRTMDKR